MSIKFTKKDISKIKVDAFVHLNKKEVINNYKPIFQYEIIPVNSGTCKFLIDFDFLKLSNEHVLSNFIKVILKISIDNNISSIAIPLFNLINKPYFYDKALKIVEETIKANLNDYDLDIFILFNDNNLYNFKNNKDVDLLEYLYDNYDGDEELNFENSFTKIKMQDDFKLIDSFQALKHSVLKEEDVAPWLSGLKDSFAEALNKWLIKKNIPNNDFWKKANIDRRLFSKIYNGNSPSKNTAILIGLALELKIDDFLDLLSRAGYTLSYSIKEDVAIRWHIENEIYSFTEIWITFEKFNLKNIF